MTGVTANAREPADTLAALGMNAEVRGRPVRAWLPGHQDRAVLVTPKWMAGQRHRRWRHRVWRRRAWRHRVWRRRVWWWQRGNASGWRRRAGAHGTAVAVAALLHRQGSPDRASRCRG